MMDSLMNGVSGMRGSGMRAIMGRAVWLVWLTVGVAVASRPGFADPMFDVQIRVENGKLLTSKSLYDGFFIEYETTDPGFATWPSYELPQGETYGFNVASKLWYHSGIVGAPVSTASGNPVIQIGESPNVIVSQNSGFQSGFSLAANLSGALHVHLPFGLGPVSPVPPVGVYGLVLQITSPEFTSSDPFVIALTNDPTFATLTPEGVAYGEQAILAAALVPEPSALGLLATAAAVAGLAGIRRRPAAARPTQASA